MWLLVLSLFFSFRGRLTESYATLFKSDGGGDTTGRADNFNQQWGWYHSFMRLADNKFLDLEVVSEKNLHNCLTYLTYSKQKDEVQDTYIKSKFKK